MPQHLQYVRRLVSLCIVGYYGVWLIGCRSSNVTDALEGSATLVVGPPAVVSYGAAYSADSMAQKGSIAAGAPSHWFSQKVSAEELHLISMRHGHKFHEPWEYMGTKDGEHYLMLYPFLGFREIYRISEEDYSIKEPFELTSSSSKWLMIKSLTHRGIKIPLIIEPQLIEPAVDFRPIQIDDFLIEGLGAGLEKPFIEEIKIPE